MRSGWAVLRGTSPPTTRWAISRSHGEYIVHALRAMSSHAVRRIDVLGYSQGGMVPRWALRFWPDTGSWSTTWSASTGPTTARSGQVRAVPRGVPARDRQQASQSQFIAALNSGAETFAGIDYTVVYSHTDEIVVPNLSASGSSALHTGGGKIANIAVQQICPADTSEHLAMGSYDAVGYALAIDAFTHAGPGDPARISASVCTQPFQPGVEPATFAANYASYLSAVGQAELQSPEVSAEPALGCYVFASCQQTAGSGSQTSGPGRSSCSSPSGRIAGRSLGPISLGMTRAQARRLFASSSTRHHRYEDFFCPARRGIRVGYASPALLHQLVGRARRGLSGRVVLVLTASPHYAIRGVRAESSLVTARRQLRLQRVFHVGRNDWYLAAYRDVRVVLKVRRGVVEEIGIADAIDPHRDVGQRASCVASPSGSAPSNTPIAW